MAELLGNREQLINGDLYCCLGALSRAEKKLLDQHLEKTGFKNEMGEITEQTPLNQGASMFIFLGVIGLLLVIGSAVYMVRANYLRTEDKVLEKKIIAEEKPLGDEQINQLVNYIYQTIEQGYSQEEIYEYLLSLGWDQTLVDSSFQQINSQSEQQNNY